MAQVEMPNILGSFLAGQQAGQEQKRKRTLSDFLQPALSGDQGALSQVFAADPDAGMQVQGMVQKQQAASREQQIADLQQAARLYPGAPDQIKAQLYGKIVDGVEGLGLAQAGSLPRQHNPEFDAGFNQFLSAIAGNDQDQGYTLSPGSKRFDAQNRMVAEVPFAPASMTPIQTDQGYAAFNPKTGAVTPLSYGDMGSTMAGPGAQGFDSLYASVPGLRVTSGMRTPEQNAKAGGVANSFHLTGQAIDIGTPSPEQRAGIAQWAAQNGYEVIDNYKDGHVHLEPRGRAPQGGGRVMPKASESQETFSQPQVVTNPQTGQQELVQFGNRGSRRAVNDYAPPPTSRDAKPPTEGERNAAGYFSRMESAERELDALTAAGHDATNIRDFYTAGQGPLRNWMASDTGQMYRQQQEDWVRAKLRKESGAVIGDDEMEREIKVYFPQPGDSQDVIRKKAQSRRVAIEAMRKSGGRAVDEGSAPSQGGSNIDSILAKYGVR